MISISQINYANNRILENIALTSQGYFLFNGHKELTEKGDEIFNFYKESFIFNSKAAAQANNLSSKLTNLRKILIDFNDGNFGLRSEEWDEELGEWCPYASIQSRINQEYSEDDLPKKIEKYDEYIAFLIKIKMENCIANYNLFMDQIRAMVTLKRPFGEMLALFTD